MKKHLVFVGGGHAHLTALLKLKDYVGRGHRVTVISSSGYHYYSGMGPGMLSGLYRPQEIRFHVRKMAEDRGAVFLEDRAVRIHPREGGEFMTFIPQKEYLLIFNLGNGKGVFWRDRFVWDGRLSFIVKDYIDRKFMREFQVPGELLEE